LVVVVAEAAVDSDREASAAVAVSVVEADDLTVSAGINPHQSTVSTT
jgi:hypothetical protein